MSVWHWIRDYMEDASDSDDERPAQLLALFMESQERKDSPDAALALLQRGRQLAQELREPWWMLFFDHWKLQCLLNYHHDNTRALPLAVAATVEARKQPYDGCPQRLCVHDDLITAYLSLDGPGYVSEIEAALRFMEAEVDEEAECRYCILQNRTELCEYAGDTPGQQRWADRLLALSQEEGNDFNAVYGRAWLCLLAWRAGDFTALGMHAAEGLALCDEENDLPIHEAEFLVWRAVLARQDKQEKEATYHLRQAESLLSRTQRTPGPRYFLARCAFHAVAGETEKELVVREQEIAMLDGKSRHHHEAKARVEQCRLLSELGRPVSDAIAKARKAVAKLRKPEELSARLDAIETQGKER